MAAKFAFFPPSRHRMSWRRRRRRRIVGRSKDGDGGICTLETKRGNQVVAVYFKNPAASLTMLYSHGNAADLDRCMICFVSSVCISVYDYSGYGKSAGKKLHIGALKKYGVKEEDVILYGQSVGVTHFRSGNTVTEVKAVVLHSPIASGLRVMYPVKKTYWFDIYKNLALYLDNETEGYTGTADDVVDWSHGKQLWECCKEKYEPLWVKGGNHCDLELFPQYIKHLKKFISAIEKSSRLRNVSGRIVYQTEDHRKSTDCREAARSSVDQRDKCRLSVEQKEKPRLSMDCREKSRSSTDRREDQEKASIA
uniref:Serine aminopeptidase S33 domain-containing protein n=1 Tax=Salix viminalis TaxID=40686 RepID=A0A6N2L0S9_SALVM